jgi:glycopeptide antibiotics resistance protein
MQLKRAHIPAVIWTLFIASSCLVPASAFRSFSFDSLLGIDKLVHFVLYAVFILLWALATTKMTATRKTYLFIVGVSYGVLIEVLQSTMSLGRSYDRVDIVANTIGCILGVLLITLSKRSLPLLKKYLPFLNKLYQPL